MTAFIRSRWLLLALTFASLLALADERPPTDAGLRILSWNISNDAFMAEHEEFQSLLLWAAPDIVLLDEVDPAADIGKLREALARLRPDMDETWNIDFGIGGGRQRCVVASRAPQEALPEFSSMIAYTEADRRYILEHMTRAQRAEPDWSMDDGIPVNGAIILTQGKRLLVVTTDLQCCGDDAESWHEYRLDRCRALPRGWRHSLDVEWSRHAFPVQHARFSALRPALARHPLGPDSGQRGSVARSPRAARTPARHINTDRPSPPAGRGVRLELITCSKCRCPQLYLDCDL